MKVERYVLKLSAKNLRANEIGAIAWWRLGDLRNHFFKIEEVVDALFVIDAAQATPSDQLQDLLDRYAASIAPESRPQAIFYSVKRSVLIGAGLTNIDKVFFASNDAEVEQQCKMRGFSGQVLNLEGQRELRSMREQQLNIDNAAGTLGMAIRNFEGILDRTIAPEFDRLGLQLEKIDASLTSESQNLTKDRELATKDRDLATDRFNQLMQRIDKPKL
jgi:hypothetical protein